MAIEMVEMAAYRLIWQKTVIRRSYRGQNGHTDRYALLDFGPDFRPSSPHLLTVDRFGSAGITPISCFLNFATSVQTFQTGPPIREATSELPIFIVRNVDFKL